MADALELGGVASSVLRLANALLSRGIEVDVYCPFHFRVDRKVIGGFNNITVYYYQPKRGSDFAINRVDGLLKRIGLSFYFRRNLSYLYIKKICMKKKYDIVHSNLLHSAIIACNLKEKFDLRHIHTLRGGIDGYSLRILRGQRTQIDGCEKHLKRIFCSVDIWIYLTEKNLIIKELMEKFKIKIGDDRFVKVYNVPELAKISMKKANGSLVRFAFMGRGEGPVVKEKGLEYALRSFIDGGFEKKSLLYVYSDGEYINFLKQLYGQEKGIIFSGYAYDRSVIYENTDVGLFPSIANESFPNVVTEFLCNGIPVIATDVGECRKLLTQNEHAMGFVISVDKDKHLFLKRNQDEEFIIAELKNYMNKYCNDRTLLNEHRANTEYINKIIDENDIVQRHMEVYGKSV